jgi:hypothetical protein
MKNNKTMNMKDYLHLYLGCQFEYTIIMADKTLLKQEGVFYLDYQFLYKWSVDYIKIKPILRPLSDMTDKEYQEVSYLHLPVKEFGEYQFSAEMYKYLLSKHFDLFGLIEAGFAIDKTKQ